VAIKSSLPYSNPKSRSVIPVAIMLALFIVANVISAIIHRAVWPNLRVVLIILLLLVPLRLTLLGSALFHFSFKKASFSPRLIYLLLAIIFFVLDAAVLPNALAHLSAREFGVTTEATVSGHSTEFGSKGTKTYYIFYNYQDAGSHQEFSHNQEVEVDLYEQLHKGSAVKVQYLTSYPMISTMVDDKHLESESYFTTAFDLWSFLIILAFLVYDRWRIQRQPSAKYEE
jgi:hypothetical protein